MVSENGVFRTPAKRVKYALTILEDIDQSKLNQYQMLNLELILSNLEQLEKELPDE